MQLLNTANGRLKRDRVPVRICDIKGRLYLEATLPPAPRSRNPKWHQQQIALRMPARPDTISIAEKKARQLGKELADGSFDWLHWRGRPTARIAPNKFIGEWIAEMRADYFDRRAETSQSLRTWKDYQGVLDRLPPHQELSPELLLEQVRATIPDTKNRQRTCQVLAMLARFAGIDMDLSLYRGHYGRKMLTPRELPSDDQIEEARNLIRDPRWRWIFGVIAAYGLRPSESMFCDLVEFPKLDVVWGKTGARLVYPCPELWAVEWQLESVLRPKISGHDSSALSNRISHAFRRSQIPFPPSVLRHCWAVRAARHYTIDEAAKMMGHSPSIHLDTYHYWISDKHLKSAFENTRSRPPDNPQ